MAWTLLRFGLLYWAISILLLGLFCTYGVLLWVNAAIESGTFINPMEEISNVLPGGNV